MAGGGSEKTHIDYAFELDLVVRSDARVPYIEREFGAFTGAGIPLFSLGGGYYRYALIDLLARFHARRGYFVAETPIIASSELYKLSGHMDYYRQNMFLLDIEGHEYAIKPMNCPYHILIFLSQLAKYRGKVPLPFKIFEAGRVHRYEPSGSLYGLQRVRGFTQDDAHIITPGEDAFRIVYEVFEEMKMLLENLFSLDLTADNVYLRLSLSDRELIGKDFMGTPGEWEQAEKALEDAAEEIASKYGIRFTRGVGEAAFYGPKIDVVMRVEEAGIVKEWQLGTIQFDFNLPRRFRIYDAVKEIYGVDDVFIIHRALIGSIERFLGTYLEVLHGRLPFPLAPVQFAIIAILTGNKSVDDEISGLASSLHQRLISEGFRSGLLYSEKTRLSGDVRNIESKIKPAVVVYVGAREVEKGMATLSVYDLRERRRRRLQAGGGGLENILADVLGLVEDLERGARELAGYAPRIPGDVSHYL